MFVCGSATTLGKSFDDELDKIFAKVAATWLCQLHALIMSTGLGCTGQ